MIDSLNWAVRQQGVKVPPKRRRRRAVVTLHRRENQGESMRAIAAAIAKLAARGDLEILFPLHMSPAVRAAIVPLLDGVDGVHLCEPLDYLTFSHTLASSDLVLTDSGGLQEEAPSLGIPVLVLRDTTERPEAVGAGVARLVGTNPQVIYDETVRLLEDEQMYREMATRANPYGDGYAAERIVAVISDRLESHALVA